jgi:hypothetical protein
MLGLSSRRLKYVLQEYIINPRAKRLIDDLVTSCAKPTIAVVPTAYIKPLKSSLCPINRELTLLCMAAQVLIFAGNTFTTNEHDYSPDPAAYVHRFPLE